jgi:hypothetical protein
MNQLNKVFEEQIVKRIAAGLEDEEEKQIYLTFEYIVKYVIDRYKAELARNKKLGVKG